MSIPLFDSVKVNTGKPLDSKYLNVNNLPYSDVNEVNNAIPLTQRHVGLTVNINNVEYWYGNGVNAGDLILKGSAGADGEINTASNIGSGTTIFKQKVGVNFEFRTLSGGTHINFVTGDTLGIHTTGLLSIESFNEYSASTKLIAGNNIQLVNTPSGITISSSGGTVSNGTYWNTADTTILTDPVLIDIKDILMFDMGDGTNRKEFYLGDLNATLGLIYLSYDTTSGAFYVQADVNNRILFDTSLQANEIKSSNNLEITGSDSKTLDINSFKVIRSRMPNVFGALYEINQNNQSTDKASLIIKAGDGAGEPAHFGINQGGIFTERSNVAQIHIGSNTDSRLYRFINWNDANTPTSGFREEINASDWILTDYNTTKKGYQYAADYSAGFEKHSLVDVNYVTGITSTLGGEIDTSLFWKTSGTTNITNDVNISSSYGSVKFDSLNSSVSLHAENNGIVEIYGGSITDGSDPYVGIYVDKSNIVGQGQICLIHNQVGNILFSSANTSLRISSGVLISPSTFRGVEYDIDYSGSFSKHSLVDKHFVTGITSTLGGGGGENYWKISGTTNITDAGGSNIIANDDSYINITNQLESTGLAVSSSSAGSTVGMVNYDITGNNGVTFILDLDNVSGYGAGAIFSDERTVKKGIEYGGNYFAGFTDRSLIDKGFLTKYALKSNALNTVTGLTTFVAPNATGSILLRSHTAENLEWSDISIGSGSIIIGMDTDAGGESTQFGFLQPANRVVFSDFRTIKKGIEYMTSGYETTDLSLTSRGYVLGAKTYAGTQTMLSSGLALRNPANSFSYTFIGAAITANRNITLPLLTGNDTLVTAAFSQTLTSKTLGSGTIFSVIPTINDGIKFTFNPNATVAGINVGAHTADPSTPVAGDIWYQSTTGRLMGRQGSTSYELVGYSLIRNSGTAVTQRPAMNINNGLIAFDVTTGTSVQWGGNLSQDTNLSGLGLHSLTMNDFSTLQIQPTGAIDFNSKTATVSIGSFVNQENWVSLALLSDRITVQGTHAEFQGVVYASDYSATYTNRSLVDRGYVLSITTPFVTGATNLGTTGNAIFSAKNGRNLEFKKLVAGANVTLTPTSTGITISSSGGGEGGSGEANDGVNIGSGYQIFKQKSGTDLEFRTLSGNSYVNLVSGDTLGINIIGLLSSSSFNTYTGNTATQINSKLATSAFNTYSGNTATLINNRVLTSTYAAYTGNTATQINSKLATSAFNTYSANTATAINNRLLTSTYAAYTANTLTTINSKLATSAFNTYSGNTATQINSKLATSAFNTYSGNTQTQINNKLNTSAFAGLTKITVGTVAPSSPNTGDLWVDTN